MGSGYYRGMADKARRLARSVGDHRTKQSLEDAATEYDAKAAELSAQPTAAMMDQPVTQVSQQQQQIQPEQDSEPPQQDSEPPPILD